MTQIFNFKDKNGLLVSNDDARIIFKNLFDEFNLSNVTDIERVMIFHFILLENVVQFSFSNGKFDIEKFEKHCNSTGLFQWKEVFYNFLSNLSICNL